MRDDVGVAITGDVTLALKFDRFPLEARAAILSRITDLTSQMANRVRSLIPDRTGKLRSEIVSRVFDDPQKVVGVVKIQAPKGSQEFAKAGALEYGAHRSTKVKSHQAHLGHVFSNRLTAPLSVMITTYSRTPNIAAHRFIRDPVDQMKDEVLRAIGDAVSEASAHE